MTNIYDKHAKAFPQVSAFVALKGDSIIKIAIKYPKDGAGRLTAYVHVIGSPMVCGTASGYGYNKTTAAVAEAFSKVSIEGLEMVDSGYSWEDQLRTQGWQVIQAV